MLDPKFFDDLVNSLQNVIPPGMREVEEDLKNKFSAIVQNAFSKLDLVTREEFDAQTKVLARTREKLEQLEAQLKPRK